MTSLRDALSTLKRAYEAIARSEFDLASLLAACKRDGGYDWEAVQGRAEPGVFNLLSGATVSSDELWGVQFVSEEITAYYLALGDNLSREQCATSIVLSILLAEANAQIGANWGAVYFRRILQLASRWQQYVESDDDLYQLFAFMIGRLDDGPH